jgi:hypothetical protein
MYFSKVIDCYVLSCNKIKLMPITEAVPAVVYQRKVWSVTRVDIQINPIHCT